MTPPALRATSPIAQRKTHIPLRSRGSARRARGLNSTIKKSYTPKTMTAFSISAQKLPFLRQPLYIAARKVQRTDNSKNINISLFFLKKFDHAINNRHTGSTFA